MRSQEMPTISQVQKASELMARTKGHLNGDGTTLMQQKKAAFLINGIVLGIHDIPDGSSQVCLDAHKAELAKTSKIPAELSCGEKDFSIDHIVSSTSDSASTQMKFAHLLEDEIGKPILENKCSMHLGVNLRVAQVKAAGRIGVHDAELESAVDMAECSNDDCDDSLHTEKPWFWKQCEYFHISGWTPYKCAKNFTVMCLGNRLYNSYIPPWGMVFHLSYKNKQLLDF